MTTLRRERRQKFEDDIQGSLLHYYARLHLEHNGNTPEYIDNTLRECREDLAATLSISAESRSEKLTPTEYAQVDKKVDAIIGASKEAQTRIEAGTGWRGRELLPPDYIFYGDLWHRLTGLEMYGAKAKAKIDTEWLKAFKECFENDISESAFCEAYVSETWEGRRAVGKPSMIVATAKAIQAANKKVESTTAQQGQGFYA